MTAIPTNDRLGSNNVMGLCHLPESRVIYPYERFWNGTEARCVLLGKDPSLDSCHMLNTRSMRYQTPGGLLIGNPLVDLSEWGRTNDIGSKTEVPALVDVRLSGLGGVWSDYNGDHLCGWGLYNSSTGRYEWADSSLNVVINIQFASTYNRCLVRVDLGLSCYKRWVNYIGASLDIEGSCSEHSCSDSGCTDGDSCYESSGATCKVRYYGATWP